EGVLAGLELGRGHALGRQVLADRARLADGRARVELEGAVHDLDVVPVLEAGERGLEAVIAEPAPGADEVGPDLDLQLLAVVPTRLRVHAVAHVRLRAPQPQQSSWYAMRQARAA